MQERCKGLGFFVHVDMYHIPKLRGPKRPEDTSGLHKNGVGSDLEFLGIDLGRISGRATEGFLLNHS